MGDRRRQCPTWVLKEWVGVYEADKEAKAFQVEGMACAKARRSKCSLGARILVLPHQIYSSFISQFKKSFWSFFFINNCNQTMLEYSVFPGVFI